MNVNGTPGAGKSATSANVFEQLMQAGKLVFDSRVPFNLKLMLPIAAAVYWIWPLDLMPGLPFDDIAVLFVALTFFVQLANQAIAKQGRQQYASDAGGQAHQAGAATPSGDGVVDTTWRVIE
jgi:uncharacterized membrane protein YkvA (DUF1232 family)